MQRIHESKAQHLTMSQFYARYVPPNASKAATDAKRSSSLKRTAISQPKHESKKRKVDPLQIGDSLPAQHGNIAVTAPTEEVAKEVKPPKRVRNKKKDSNDTGQTQTLEDNDEIAKHSKVLERFAKSKQRTERLEVQQQNAEEYSQPNQIHPERAEMVHDLEPIPQPQNAPAPQAAPTYSTVPEWLGAPITADDNARIPFDKLGVPSILSQSLKAQGIDLALPIQTAVLPLLLDKYVEQRPDLCVAAATGSGKTLAYVLPILNDLKTRKVVHLQAVVVVPTRALVKQVVETIRLCSTGIDAKIGTAEGSKTLAEEQKQLVEETQIYDPVEYQKRQDAPIDWSTFSLDDVLEEAEKTDPLAGIGFVTEYLSRVDILVCTPGRLVEHLQSTKGFNLDHVQWFVADEADRLLNESYHEWLETVLPALKSQKATEKRDQLLEQMYMHAPKRRVTKILLSATMTSDISQLLGLELTNPKMVVVEDSSSQEATDMAHMKMTDTNAEYHLPPRLQEFALAFKDSENKPLYLLELLNEHILVQEHRPKEHQKQVTTNGNVKDQIIGEDEDEANNENDENDPSDTSSSGSSDSDDDDTSSVCSLSSSSTESSAKSSSATPLVVKSSDTKISTAPSKSRVLIFTKSTESAHRLSRLLSLLIPQLSSLISTFTRSSSSSSSAKPNNKSLSKTRTKILQSFTSGKTRILISTDLAARGLDIPNLEHVVNYDVPTSALTYVHRVGRTARAGLAGHAWTLVEHRQGKWFWEVIGGKKTQEGGKTAIGRGGTNIEKINISIDKDQWAEKYEEALKKLGDDVRGQ